MASPKNKKSETPAPEPVKVVTLKPSEKAKAERIARQKAAEERNAKLRMQGKLTPWEEKREARRQRRLKDPLVISRRKRREADAMAEERAKNKPRT